MSAFEHFPNAPGRKALDWRSSSSVGFCLLSTAMRFSWAATTVCEPASTTRTHNRSHGGEHRDHCGGGGFVADTFNGSTATANLTLVGQAPNADTMSGGSGNDFIYFRAGDVISGRTGNDRAVGTLSTTGVTLDLVARF